MTVTEGLRIQQGPFAGGHRHLGQLLGRAFGLVHIPVGGQCVRADVRPQQSRGALVGIADGVIRLVARWLGLAAILPRRVRVGDERRRAEPGRDGRIGRRHVELERAAADVGAVHVPRADPEIVGDLHHG